MKCRKRGYRDTLSAKIALMSTQRADRDELRFYYCSKCRCLHLTSQRKRRTV